MKVILDTNWLISYLIKKETSPLAQILTLKSISIVSGKEQMEEYLKKIYLDKFRKYLPVEPAIDFIVYFTARADFIETISVITLCRDEKDNYLLALAKDSEADFLIAGDKDLLVLKNFENTTICTLTEFLENHLPKFEL
jgi:uncharacterized protein